MGSIVKSIGKAVKSVVKGVIKFVKKYWKAIVITALVVAAVVFTLGAGAPAAAAVAGGEAGAVTGAGAGAGLLGPSIGAEGATAAASGAIAGGSTVSAVQGTLAAPELAAVAPIATETAAAPVAGAATEAGAPMFTQAAANATAPLTGSTTADALVSAQATTESLVGTTSATSVQQTSTQALISNAQAPLSDITKANFYANADGLELKSLSEYLATNPVPKTPVNVIANAGQKVVEGAKTVGRGAMNFADKHPLLAGIGLQAVGGMLKRPEGQPERQVALQAGMASPEGRVWNGSGLIDYKDSAIASQGFKQRAGVAPISVTATPQAELPAPSGLLNPPTPAKITVANEQLVNQGLLSNVRITGT